MLGFSTFRHVMKQETSQYGQASSCRKAHDLIHVVSKANVFVAALLRTRHHVAHSQAKGDAPSILCQRFGVFVFMCSSCGWAQRIWNWFRGLVWQQRLCCMGHVMSLKSQRPRAVFQVPVFCVRYLQLPDKLLVSLKAGCECQLCSAPCCFNVYPVNRAGTKITQITGTLVKWHWLLTQKCIYSEMLGICWTTRWYFWI